MLGKNIKYVGVNDRSLDLFESQFVIPDGMAYNSYLIIDEKIALFDTVDASFTEEWLLNVERSLEGRTPDYLIVSHMEPDHSAGIIEAVRAYPNMKVVASDKAFKIMKSFYGEDFKEHRIVVSDGEKLDLGKHKLTFITAPMVHWPEVMLTYESTEQLLFSADAFGKFGALDTDGEWACEARRYYFGIVGKYGAQVQSLLKKIAHLDIRAICPLHGPMLTDNIEYYVALYNTWSSYTPENEGVTIAYTSVYGNTEQAVKLLSEKLLTLGCRSVSLFDLARCDMAEAVEDAFRYDRLVLATTTYNGDIFPFMREFIHHLTERGYSNRTVAFIENGSWAPMATKVMREMLEKSKKLTFTNTNVKIHSALNEESLSELEALASELAK